jgi:hypothetical protein
VARGRGLSPPYIQGGTEETQGSSAGVGEPSEFRGMDLGDLGDPSGGGSKGA